MMRLPALVQGVYFAVTGIWPILSLRTFMMITGPKTDVWLVKTVGLILAVIGGVLLVARARGEINLSVIALAVGAAAGLAIVELVYVLKKVISPIYLLDAIIEIILIGAWVAAVVSG